MIPYPVSYPQYMGYSNMVSYTWQVLLYSILNVISILCYVYLCVAAETVFRLMGV